MILYRYRGIKGYISCRWWYFYLILEFWLKLLIVVVGFCFLEGCFFFKGVSKGYYRKFCFEDLYFRKEFLFVKRVKLGFFKGIIK